MRYKNRRSSAILADQDNFIDEETAVALKRVSRQQKRLVKKAGTSNVVDISQDQVIKTRNRSIRLDDVKVIEPMTDTQRDVFDAFDDPNNIAFVLYGSAGTGKTFLGCNNALIEVLDPRTEYEKIIIVRSSVQARDMGFLPGTDDEKMKIYEAPYKCIFSDLVGRKDAYEKLKDSGKLEFMSSSFLRGLTMDNSVVIVDEAQNMSWEELNSIATRIGKNSKIIFCGDGKQDDLHYKKNDTSGFKNLISVTTSMSRFKTFKFGTEDIVRSAFVKQWIIACEQNGL